MTRAVQLSGCCRVTEGNVGVCRVVRIARVSVFMVLGLVALGPWAALADDADAAPPGASEEEATDLKTRYAMARLKLAELDLQRAVQLNRPVANAVGGLEIARLTNHVRLMQRQLEIAQGKPQSSAREVALAAAELAVETAQADLDAARAANQRTPGAVKDINVQRLETQLEIASVRLQMFRNPTYVPSPIDEMQWHIDQLTEQLIDLRHLLETRSANTFGNKE